MSGDGQQEESLDGMSATGGTDAGGVPPLRQVPSQAGPGRSDGDAEGGTVLSGPWTPGPVGDGPGDGGPADGAPGHRGPAEPGGEAGSASGAAVPMQREGGRGPAAAGLALSDAQLILQMRDGDDLAYEELFRRHSDRVRRYARTCCRDAHTADDLTAEVFARTLQAVRGGKGPEEAVRAYLMTAVRHVAAAWTKTAKREQLVDDFAVFAAQAVRSSDMSDADTLDLGADVLAMHEAEQSMAMKAFRSLPERWQAVLWHTTVEEESPGEVAPLFGLTANATAVLASRAREGLKQAYLQAHVSQSLTSGGNCARYADRLGAYARGGLRIRAERGLRKHLDECARCRVAAGELAHVNAGIPALLPVAVIGWFAGGYALKAAGIVAGGAAGAGAAAVATGGSSSGGSAAGGAAASEGLGAPAKAGIAAAVAMTAVAGLVWALIGGETPKPETKPETRPPVVAPAVPSPPPPAAKSLPPGMPAQAAPAPAPPPKADPTSPAPAPTPTPKPKPKPPVPAPPPSPTPSPMPTPAPPPPPAPPTVYQVSELDYSVHGDHTEPEVVLGASSWVWRRSGLSVGGTQYAHGVTVNSHSSVTIRLNRSCTRYEAMVGVDDLARGLGSVRFSVFDGDGARLWQSPVMNGNHPAVPVGIGVEGRQRIRLVVEPHTPFGGVTLADWAESRISCR
ncbi:sigma-70 family RNA polymerase sigma factor [Streptomyces sp. JH14]|uniref:sigma-70 family RNA polymerase sigma factor n=1 Tax=Streptomyces sp. JH14 TaxID=2793630 RepID=UPI0023F890AD|nr:sigma-70 family RNA polymerase sigma factor [Streptomyces sp. JH14]MDF6043376.1 sigma-70 family RNA polymerase sigma factor [Streptomyces sp. JH14]